MGFGASIYTYPKRPGGDYAEMKNAESLLEFELNPWAQEHFATAAEYAQEYRKEEFSPLSEEVVDYYRERLTTDEFNHKHLYKDYGNWCSNGSGEIYNALSEMGTAIEPEKHDCYRLLSKKDIVAIFNYFLDHVLNHAPEAAEIQYAFTYERDEDGEIPEVSPKINLIPCDGFEVRFLEDNSILRFDTNPEWESIYGFPRKYYDEWEESGYIEGVRACAKILGEVDFENSYVIYSGGW